MYVYFIEADCRPAVVKIGISFDIKSRVVALQTAIPFGLRLIGFVVCASETEARELEAALHRKFKRRHMRGEWFRLSPKTRDAIESIIGENRSMPERINPPIPPELEGFSLIEHRMNARINQVARKASQRIRMANEARKVQP